MKILIIESDPSFAQITAQALESLGAETLIVHDGQEGMNLAREERPAAMILSVELGDRLHGGFSWCNRIKKDDELKDIPLLLVSSLATEDTFEQHRRLKTRADEYLIKPFPTDRLLERMESMVPSLARAEGAAADSSATDVLDEDDPFGLDLDFGEEDEPLFGPLDGQGGATLVDGSAGTASKEDVGQPVPATPPPLASPPDALGNELDLEELFSEGTERYAPDPLDWQDLVAGEVSPAGDEERSAAGSDESTAAVEAKAAAAEERATAAEETAAAAEARAAAAESRVAEAEARLRSLELLLEETRGDLDSTRARLQQALASQREAMEEQDRLQDERSTLRVSLEGTKQEAAQAEERARKALLARDEAQRKAEALEERLQGSLSWQSRAEEAERALAEHRALVERLQARLQEDEQVRQRAQKAVAVAAELLQTLGRPTR